MNQLEILLHCPFCKSKPIQPIFTDYIGDSYAPYWTIDCSKCPCTMSVDGESPAGVIKAWNTR